MPCFRVLAALFLVCLSACGPALERSRATDKFRSIFGCAPSRVSSNGSGYRIEGCGVTAYVQCFDDQKDTDDELGHLLFHGDDTCMLEHSERRTMPTEKAQGSARVIDRQGEKRIRAEFSTQGAQVTLLAAPKLDRERVVVIVRPLSAQQRDCSLASMWIDGEALSIEGLREVRNRRGHEVQFAIERSALTDVSDALRVALQICGQEVELDPEGKKALGLFEIRFREQLAQLDAP